MKKAVLVLLATVSMSSAAFAKCQVTSGDLAVDKIQGLMETFFGESKIDYKYLVIKTVDSMEHNQCLRNLPEEDREALAERIASKFSGKKVSNTNIADFINAQFDNN